MTSCTHSHTHAHRALFSVPASLETSSQLALLKGSEDRLRGRFFSFHSYGLRHTMLCVSFVLFFNQQLVFTMQANAFTLTEKASLGIVAAMGTGGVNSSELTDSDTAKSKSDHFDLRRKGWVFLLSLKNLFLPQWGPAGPRRARPEPPSGLETPLDVLSRAASLVHADDELSAGSPGCRHCPWPRPSLVTARGPRPSVPARGSSPWSPATTSWTVKVTTLPR